MQRYYDGNFDSSDTSDYSSDTPKSIEPTHSDLDMLRGLFGDPNIQDTRAWIRQGYVDDTDAASTLSDAIDQLPHYDWPDDAPDTIVLDRYGHQLHLTREESYEYFPRSNNYRDDGGTFSTYDDNDPAFMSDFINLRPSNSLFRLAPYREWYRLHIFAHWIAEGSRLHSVQLTLAELIEIWKRYRHPEAHNFNFNPLNSNENNYYSSSNNSDEENDLTSAHIIDSTTDYPSTVLTPPSTPRSGSSLDTGTPPIDHGTRDSELLFTAEMTPPSSPIDSDIGDMEDM